METRVGAFAVLRNFLLHAATETSLKYFFDVKVIFFEFFSKQKTAKPRWNTRWRCCSSRECRAASGTYNCRTDTANGRFVSVKYIIC